MRTNLRTKSGGRSELVGRQLGGHLNLSRLDPTYVTEDLGALTTVCTEVGRDGDLSQNLGWHMALGNLLDMHVQRKPLGLSAPFAWHTPRADSRLADLRKPRPSSLVLLTIYFLPKTQGFAHYGGGRGGSTQGPTQRPQGTLVHIPVPW